MINLDPSTRSSSGNRSSAITKKIWEGEDGRYIMLGSLSKIDIKSRCAVCAVLSLIGIWTVNLLDFPVGAIGLIPSIIGLVFAISVISEIASKSGKEQK